MTALAAAKDRRSLVTPEGIDLKIQLAPVGARAGALVIDLIIMFVSLILVSFLIFYGVSPLTKIDSMIAGELGVSLFLLALFFFRNFYFTFFEMGRHAATPGKRFMKIRVAARGNPRLTANAVFARNALREIELFLPLQLLLSPSADGVDGWIRILAIVWVSIFLFFPLFNKDKLRGGDLIAGTWVVKAPKPILAEDLATAADHLTPQFPFTAEQINAYGVKELHVLEDVLRARDPETVKDVSFRIRRKIGWVKESQGELDIDFLKAYYKALRGRLETQLLMGHRRKDKFDVR